MVRHHTKDKGDAGVGFVIADLLGKGIQVALTLSEHLPFDCIAISDKNQLVRLSVKFRSKVQGHVTITFRGNWADRHGAHSKPQDKTAFDATAVYCPDTAECYYIRNDEVDGASFILRLDAAKNGQTSGVRLAENFRDPLRMFNSI